ncbi:MAG: hypothetical protein IT299_07005, partial [Dehalococcoidia bacterium]|nr:hypothetical protein [Dehalococcoidia bacterium]
VVGDAEARVTIAARQWAQALADTLTTSIGYVRADVAEVLAALEKSGVRTNVFALQPSLSADAPPASVRYGADGRPDWVATCTGLPAPALLGGPALRAAAPLRHTDELRRLAEDWDPASEVRRGIFEVAGLYSEPGERAGWLDVSCASARMAAWLAACLVFEGIEARCDEDRLCLPVAPSFTLHEDVRDLVMAVARARQYWNGA